MTLTSKSKVYFFYEKKVSLRNRARLKRFIESIFKNEKKKLDSLNYIFCSDKRLLEINKQFLNHDYYTDTITFELSPAGSQVQGEIYISVDRIKDNSKKLGESFSKEIHRVIFHSALHLCGYRDETAIEKMKIREREDFYLEKYSI